jgi:outer membrane translocation and assembly module TamA
MVPPDTPPELVDELTELLTTDVVTSGVGLQVQFDTRDNIFTPMAGFTYEFEYLIYNDAFGSDLDYGNWSLEGLNYFKLSEHWRFALRLDAEGVDSDEVLPPFAVPGITLRGVPAARYQGERVAVIEGELTWQIDTRWSALAFLGSGWADNSTSDLLSSGSVVNKGLGFRYNIARRYGMHVGIDVAQGPEDTVWYIQVGSAW